MYSQTVHITRETQACLFGLGAVLLWSTVASAFKLGLRHLQVEQLLLLGATCSWLLFALIAAVTGQWRLLRSDWTMTAALGLINPWAYYLVLFAAYDRLPAHIAQPLNYTWAITLAILAVPILKQPLTGRMLAGIAVSYAGVLVLLGTADAGPSGSWSYSGIVLALGSTVLWSAYWLFSTRSASAPIPCMFWSFSIGLPLVWLTCLAGPGLPQFSTTHLFYGGWVGLIEMGVTFLLWQQALRLTTNAAAIGQLIFLSPFLSLVIIHFTLGEHITWGAVLGLVIIVLGLRVNQTSSPR